MSAHQIVRKYVALVAEYGPLAPRLRALGGRKLNHLNGEREPFADVVDRATKRVCTSGLPHFIDSPDRWPFFAERPSDVRTMLLVHRALDAARKAYVKETSWSGGPALNPQSPKRFDPDAEAALARHTEAGQALVNEPTVALAREEAEAREQCVRDVQVAENAAFVREVDEWAATLPPRKWEVVWRLIWGFSYEEIRLATCNERGRMGASERIIKPLREKLIEIADRHLITSVDGWRYDDPLFDSVVPQPAVDASLSGAPEAAAATDSAAAHAESELVTQLANADVDPLDAGRATLEIASALRAPEVCSDEVSENTLRGYQRAARNCHADWSLPGHRFREPGKRKTPAERRAETRAAASRALAQMAREKAKKASAAAREDEAWARLVREAVRFGITEEMLLRLCEAGVLLTGFGETLASMLSPAANDEPSESSGEAA